MISILLGPRGIARTAALFLSVCATAGAIVDPPQFTPAGEVSPVGFGVTIASSTPGAMIHYTLDGTDPQTSSSALPLGGVVWIGKSVTLKAKAWNGGEESTISSIDYEVTGAISAGWDHVLAIRATSGGLSWGLQTDGRLGNGLTAATNVDMPGLIFKSAGQPLMDGWAVAAGANHSLVADLTGNVWGFGSNSFGQLGNGGILSSAYPVQVLKSTTAGDHLTDCMAVAAGEEFSVALTGTGDVYAWGSRANGRLGDGSSSSYRSHASPVQTIDSGNPPLTGIVEISTSNGHVLAREKHAFEQSGALGRVWSWGLNTNTQLGTVSTANQTRARNVMRNGSNAITDVTAVAAGAKHSALVRWKDGDVDLQGSVWTIGYEGHGALGNGANAISNVQFPVRVLKQGGGYLDNVVEISAGPRHTLARDNEGHVWSWGFNAKGEIGDGTVILRNRAVQVKDPSGGGFLSNIVKIAAGGSGADGFSIAIAADGLTYAWGANSSGQLGNYNVTTGATSLPTTSGIIMMNIPPGISASATLVENIEAGEIAVSATPSDPDGPSDIARVDFYSNGIAVAGATSAPWTAVWDSAPAGDHQIVAKVTDRAGNTSQTTVNTFHVYPADADEDGDGLTNGEEKASGLDAFDADTDDDGMGDGFESYYQFPADSDVNEGAGGKGPDDDFDGDSVPNQIEARDGRIPRSASERPEVTISDPKTIRWFGVRGIHYRLQWTTNLVTWNFHDGTYVGDNNGFEFLVSDVVNGPPPGFFAVRLFIFSDPDEDSDGDGLSDLQETYYGSDPGDTDSDNDGMPDGWEAQYGLSPTVTSGVDGSGGDFDGDGMTNGAEFAAGTDPNHADTDLDGIPDGTDPLPAASATFADPDGLNPPAGSTANLRAFWDFETQQTPSSPAVFPDRSGANRHANSALFGPVLPGMPSKSASIGGFGYVAAPASSLQSLTSWTVTGWFRLSEGEIAESPVVDAQGNGNYKVIYSLYDQQGTGPAPQTAPIGKGNVLVVRKSAQGETWMVGGYEQTTWFNQPPNANGNPRTIFSGAGFTRFAEPTADVNDWEGSTDDGAWHHFAVTRTTGSFGQKVYIDGKQVVSAAVSEVTGLAFDADTRLTFGRLYPAHNMSAFTGETNLDRARVYGRALSQADVTALYRQDIDSDGLWDITEVKTALWRDANSDGVPSVAEYSYLSSPFQWQPVTRDLDDDGATDLEEQTAGTNIIVNDTDGDLIPDGWELEHGLDPLDPSDGSADPDSDGLSNRGEWQYNTNPHNWNSDGGDPNNPDNVSDGGEVNNGSDPNDPTDGGQEPDEDDKLNIHLGVGDQSGSHSEDYVLHCYKINKETGAEQRIYTLRSGGFGQYKEEDPGMFRKGETYTFQIHWQGSNLASQPASPGVSAEGPDYDYTFKVEPAPDAEGILLDSYDPENGEFHLDDPILGEQNDLADFQSRVTKRRVVFLAAETVIGEPGTPEEAPEWVVAEAYPKPTVEMTVTSTELSGGTLHVTLQGTVTDPISKFATRNSERPQTLKFIQDGQELRSIPIGSSVGTGFTFNETLIIPNAGPFSYLLRAETSPNIAGLKGFDQSVVSLTWHEDASAYPALAGPLSIYFPVAPSSGAVDEAVVYVGSGSPPGGANATETAAASGSYSGTFLIPSTPNSINADATFEFAVPRTLSATVVDSITLDFRYSAPGYPQNALYGRWQETGPDTRIFRPFGWFFGDRSLQVAYTENLPGTPSLPVVPATIRFPVLPGQGDDPREMKIVSGNTTYDLIKIGGAWYPQDPLDSESAKLFAPSGNPVPKRLDAPGYSSGEGQLTFTIKIDSETEFQAPPLHVLPGIPESFDDSSGILGGPLGPLSLGEPWTPGQPVQSHQMEWAYRLINAEDPFALELLDGFLRGGHQLQMGDIGGDLDLDVTLNDIFTDEDNIWTIQIEEDWNPVYCARLLFEGLKQSSVHPEVYDHYEFEDPFDDILAFKTALDSAVQQTRETAVFATQLYLSGFGIINEGADWILVINDVSEGHYESLAGALPFVPAGLIKSGGHLILRKGSGEVLESLDAAGVDALREVSRESDLRVMGTLMDEHQFGESIRKALASDGGRISPPTDQQGLRKAMEAVSPRPKGKVHAHHDFPWSMRAWFAEHGIDVNDPAFGRWVSELEHQSWHSGAGMGSGGQFHNAWRTFIAEEQQSGITYTVSQILDKLAQIRSQFPVTS